MKLTGVLSTGAVAPGVRPEHGVLVAPGLNAMVHQHFFSMRLDMDVDGVENAVEEVWTESLPPGPGNPVGNAFRPLRRRLETELEARRRLDPVSARWWEIVNPGVRHRLGEPVAYRLVPGENATPFAQPDAPVSKRAGFIRNHLWVTPYAPGERYAAGDYPSQHPGGAGLPEWTSADRPVAGRDIVVWYTFGHHHVPRPEDWPVMPVATIGFMLKPVGFFERNPALDVPPVAAARRELSSRRGRPMSGVEGRVALVTGASSGIGAATARALAEGGAHVALASRGGDDLGIEGALAQRCDVRDLAQVEALVAACVERFGGLDILVVNAGVGAYGDFLDLKPEWLDEMIDTNVKGFLHTIRAGLPRLLESSSADLVAVTSIAGQRAPEGEAVYAASKHAQIGFMRSLDHELFRRGVRCSILAPGGVETAFAMGRGRTPEDPDLPGMLRSEEVADAVMYAVTRPRTGRIFEASILPMADDSMG